MYYERSGMFGGRYRGKWLPEKPWSGRTPGSCLFSGKKPLIAERLLDG